MLCGLEVHKPGLSSTDPHPPRITIRLVTTKGGLGLEGQVGIPGACVVRCRGKLAF